MILLDSSALLAALRREPGGERVAAALSSGRSALTTANLAEVLSVLATRAGMPISETLRTVDQLPIEIVSVSREIAIQSAELHARWPRSGLSLGDRICLAAGIVQGWPILTADAAWLRLETDAKVELIRSAAGLDE
ncbi:PilT domain-containing protein [Candidatus Glomeribacter gigasporarum BEG34]|uniref:Ribonuclease VapC n=1 Tax=Candidatus Glomeribacter gigasporarum BEG34 TaxID=1070319 RepID=G2JA09_9BURK|nr:type II toxin-antitoxin system VapC family toxin [Candidatus Glomeribacter gigasporarum]CCD29606.1 PilT domain-containing protein [Candidatus Glomeribacter gigasporarum BEG34]